MITSQRADSDFASDADLLDRFACHQDEQSFAELVRRHGPMVLAVCLQILHRHHDAQDAFQATFQTLVMRSKSIRQESSVASWLYKVAYRTAMRAAKRRQSQDSELVGDPISAAHDPLQTIYEQSLQAALHEELAKLPSDYRDPLVLCYLQGMTRSQAADALECTPSSIKGRLARAKRVLRARLSRRGVALSLAMVPVTNGISQAGSSMSPELVATTTNDSLVSLATGTLDHLTPEIANLTHEGVHWMSFTTATKAAVLTTTAASVLLGLTWLSGQSRAETPRGTHTIQVAQSDLAVEQAGDGDAIPVQLVADDAEDRMANTFLVQPGGAWVDLTLDNRTNQTEIDRLRREKAYIAKKAKAYFKLRDAQLAKAESASDRPTRMEAEAHAELHEAEAEKLDAEARQIEQQLSSMSPKANAVYWSTEVSPAPCCRTNNLAYGRNVKASSQEEIINNFAQLAVDGDLGTRWCAEDEGSGEWLQVDLGSQKHVKAMRIHWEMMETAYAYTIESSTDGKQWTTRVDTTSDPQAQHMPEHEFDAPDTRYLRITFEGCEQGYWASIREIEVTDDSLSDPPTEAWEKVRSDADPSEMGLNFLFLGVEG